MQTTIILIGIALVAAIAIVFFGIMGNGGSHSPITDLLGVETLFNDMRRSAPDGRCVVYISTVYEKLRISAEDAEIDRAARYTTEHIKALCASGRGRAARVDGNNYVAVISCSEDAAERFCAGFMHDDKRLADDIEASIGVYAADGGTDFKTAAGYAKKISRQAKNRELKYLICDKKSLAAVIEKDEIEKNIESLIDNDEFHLMFQPLVDAHDERIIGCEALIRLRSAHGSVLPDNFLDIIQREKLNLKFDLYVYRKCCIWAKRHLEKNLRITCNFSRSALASENLPRYLKCINDELGLKYSAVAIEVTEDSVEPDFEQLRSNIAELKESGFGICLDDFGKAFTFIGDISRLRPDVIKIDKVMLYDAAADEQGRMVFENIVQLAKKMDATVLCEGVETEWQRNMAKAAQCDVLQGYYFYRPMPEDEFDKLIENTGGAAV